MPSLTPAKPLSILVINPGSTSTKISVFENETERFSRTIAHPVQDLKDFKTPLSQIEYREKAIRAALEEWGRRSFDAIAARGGLVKPIASGTYLIDEALLADSRNPATARHVSSLGAILADNLGREMGIRAYIVDPVVVDELEPVARLSGAPDFPRCSIFHALNQKAVARLCAEDLGLKYEESRMVVAHLGGGISVGAHRCGRVIDVNNALNGEGPFSPERCGGLPAADLIKACFSQKYSQEELLSLTNKSGGLAAYLGSTDLRECEAGLMRGDELSHLVFEALAYQVAKEIGAMAAVLNCRLEAIVLTGGLAHSARFTEAIKNYVSALAPVKVYPGEREMEALALGVLRVLRGRETAKNYSANIHGR